ncbi:MULTISPECIES: ATP-binding protein [Nostocales]|uniref:Uncharacterized protein n=3 Tax=Nostocales TaxID=1161 RepID=A0A0C1R4Z2_9CYAN
MTSSGNSDKKSGKRVILRRGNRNRRNGKKFKWKGAVTVIVSVVSLIIAFMALVIGQEGLVPFLKEINKPPCGLAIAYDQEKYKQVENTFFQNFDSRKQPASLNLWQNNGSPRPLGEILISQSKELSSLRDVIINNRIFSPNQLIFVYGSAGSGKSQVAKALKVGDSVALIELSELRYNRKEKIIHPMTQLEPDLIIGSVLVSQMADFRKEEKEKEFIQLLNDIAKKDVGDNTSIIIDGLDELHPNSSIYLLRVAREYIAKHSKKNIIFVGRGEAFRDYVEQYTDSKNYKDIEVKPLYLNNSQLLKWYIAEFLAFPEWEKNPDFVPNVQEVETLFNEINDVVQQKPELRHFLQTTEPVNVLLRSARNKRYDVDEISSLVFKELLNRNTKTHNRPSTELTTEAAQLYHKALIQASRTLNSKKRSNDGTVTAMVNKLDTLKVQHNQHCLEVEVYKVLNRSGVVNLNPFKENQLEYTFQPLTIQKFMAKRESFSDI